MSHGDHDKIFSTISHLPHLLAFSLVDMITQRANANELLKFAASGFKDFTRIAASSPEMWKDITLANKKFILDDIKHFENQIKLISLYPNPTSGRVNLVINETAGKDLNIQVYDVVGRLIINKTIQTTGIGQNNELDLSAFTNDQVFFVKVQIDNKTETLKLLKTNN